MPIPKNGTCIYAYWYNYWYMVKNNKNNDTYLWDVTTVRIPANDLAEAWNVEDIKFEFNSNLFFKIVLRKVHVNA